MDEESQIFEIILEATGFEQGAAKSEAMNAALEATAEAASGAGASVDAMGKAMAILSAEAAATTKAGGEVAMQFRSLQGIASLLAHQTFDALAFAMQTNAGGLKELTVGAVDATVAVARLEETSRAAAVAIAEATNANTAPANASASAYSALNAAAIQDVADAMGALYLAQHQEVEELQPFIDRLNTAELAASKFADTERVVADVLGRGSLATVEYVSKTQEMTASQKEASAATTEATNALRIAIRDQVADLQPLIDKVFEAEAEEKKLADIEITLADALGRSAGTTVTYVSALQSLTLEQKAVGDAAAEAQAKLTTALLKQSGDFDVLAASAAAAQAEVLRYAEAAKTAAVTTAGSVDVTTASTPQAASAFQALSADASAKAAEALNAYNLAVLQGVADLDPFKAQVADARDYEQQFADAINAVKLSLGDLQPEIQAAATATQAFTAEQQRLGAAYAEAQAKMTLAIRDQVADTSLLKAEVIATRNAYNELIAAQKEMTAQTAGEAPAVDKATEARAAYAAVQKNAADSTIILARAQAEERKATDEEVIAARKAVAELALWSTSLKIANEQTLSFAGSNALARGSLDALGQSTRIGASGLNGWNAGILLSRGNVLALIAVLAVLSEKYAIDFQKSLANMEGNTGQTADAIARIRDETMKLGAQGPIALDDIVVAFRHASDEGYRNAASMVVVEAGWKGAIATGGDAATVTNTLATEMRNWGYAADQANQAMGTLLVGAQQGNQTLDQLVSSLSKVGPTASSIHMPMSDAVALVSELTRATGNSSIAQTYSEGILTHIINPTKAAVVLMGELKDATGVDLQKTFTDFTQGLISFQTVMERVKFATASNQQETMALFGGIRGGIGALQLMNGGLEQYVKIAAKAKNGGKDLNEQFKQQQDTLSNKLGMALNNTKIHMIDLAAGINKVADALDRLNRQDKGKKGGGGGFLGDVASIGSEYFQAINPVGHLISYLASAPEGTNYLTWQGQQQGSKAKATDESTAALQRQATQLQHNIAYLKDLENAGVMDQKQSTQLWNDMQREAKIREELTKRIRTQTEAIQAQEIARMQGAKGAEAETATHFNTETPGAIKASYQRAQSDFTDAALKLAYDQKNHPNAVPGDTAQLAKASDSLAQWQKVIDAASKLEQDKAKGNAKALDELTAQQAKLTNLEAKASNEYFRTGQILPSTQHAILSTNDSIVKFQKIMDLLTTHSDAMTAAQQSLQTATTAAYDDFHRYGHILPEHQQQIVSDTLTIQRMQDAVARLTANLNTGWSQFGRPEQTQTNTIDALKTQNSIADLQLNLTAEQKAVIDASFALQQAQHQVQLDELKLRETEKNPKADKAQIAAAKEAVANDRGAVSVAQAGVTSAQYAATQAAAQQHYQIVEAGISDQITHLQSQSNLLQFNNSLTADQKAVLQAQFAIAIDQRQIQLDTLKMTADIASHATPAQVAQDKSAIYADSAKAKEDRAALANASATEKASHYTDQWALKLQNAQTASSNASAELTKKYYDLSQGITNDGLPSIETLTARAGESAAKLKLMTDAATKAATVIANLDPTVRKQNALQMDNDRQSGIIALLQHQSSVIGLNTNLSADQKSAQQAQLQVLIDSRQKQIDANKLQSLRLSGTATPDQIAQAVEAGVIDGYKKSEDKKAAKDAEAQANTAASRSGDAADKYNKAFDKLTVAIHNHELYDQSDLDAIAKHKAQVDAWTNATIKADEATGQWGAALTAITQKTGQAYSDAMGKLTIAILKHAGNVDADTQAAIKAREKQDKLTQAQWDAAFAVGDLATQSSMLAQAFSTLVSNTQSQISSDSAVASATRTVATDQAAIANQLLQNIVTGITNETAVISAKSGLLTAQQSAQTKSIDDQTSIMRAQQQIATDSVSAQVTMIGDLKSGDTQKMALDQRIAAEQATIDRDALAVALATQQMNEQLGRDQVKIAQDGVTAAQHKADADASAATWQSKLLSDQLKVDQAQLQVAIDNQELAKLQLQAYIAVNSDNPQVVAYGATLNALLVQMKGDNATLNNMLSNQQVDTAASQTSASNSAIQAANDAKQTAIDQAALALDQGNWQQALSILQQQQQADSQNLTSTQGSESLLSAIRDYEAQALAIQEESMQSQNLAIKHEQAMIDLRTDLTSDQKNLLKMQLDVQNDQLTIQEDQLKLAQVVAQGGDALSMLQANNQILADSYKLQEDQYAVAQATYTATLDANDTAALEALIKALQQMLANVRSGGGARMSGSTAAQQWNQVSGQVVSTVGSRRI